MFGVHQANSDKVYGLKGGAEATEAEGGSKIKPIANPGSRPQAQQYARTEELNRNVKILPKAPVSITRIVLIEHISVTTRLSLSAIFELATTRLHFAVCFRLARFSFVIQRIDSRTT